MKIAFVFPGQGSQHVGMGKEIFDRFRTAREVFSMASDVLGYDVPNLIFNGPEDELNRTFRTQPCILTTSIAIYKVLLHMGIEPSVMAGHSLGEYSALAASGVVLFEDMVRITEKRGQFMQEAVPEGKGLMAAIIGLEREKVDEICSVLKSGYASSANYNCPGQIVIAGEKNAVEEAIELCKAAGAKRAMPLSVSVPSHCRLMENASQRLAELFDTTDFHPMSIPVVNNADALFLPDEVNAIKSSLVRQLSSPLLWEDSVKTINDCGIDTFIEVGPGKILSGLIKRIAPDVNVYHTGDLKSLDYMLSSVRNR
ncbi:MAG: ACP S-malonyltransferase [Nitrospirota bacterium]